MTASAFELVKGVILSLLEPRLRERGVAGIVLHDDMDLRTEGLVDSLGFVQLLSGLEERLGLSIDLADLDPEELTRVGPLARHIAALPVGSSLT